MIRPKKKNFCQFYSFNRSYMLLQIKLKLHISTQPKAVAHASVLRCKNLKTALLMYQLIEIQNNAEKKGSPPVQRQQQPRHGSKAYRFTAN
jgi:hypothetical protein